MWVKNDIWFQYAWFVRGRYQYGQFECHLDGQSRLEWKEMGTPNETKKI